MTTAASGLADLLRALTQLEPADAEARAAIADCLGLTLGNLPAGDHEKSQPEAPPPQTRAPRKVETSRTETAQAEKREAQELPPEPLQPVERSAILTPDFTAPRLPPDWLERVEPFPESAASPVPAPAPDGLLEPLWTRGILSGALATFAETGPLDIRRIVRAVAGGRLLPSVPRRPWPTLARGAQILVERSEALAPFKADQDDLVQKLRAVVGASRLEILDFEGCPGRIGYFERRRRLLPGTVVLALTDLGIGPRGFGELPVRWQEWYAFAAEVRRRGCPLVAFVPYGSDRWPPRLPQVMKIFVWDKTTSVRTVRRVIGRALAVPRGPRS